MPFHTLQVKVTTMDLSSAHEILPPEAVDRFASPRAQMFRTAEGWQNIAAREMLRRVAGLSKALGELGIKSGDRVAILAPNCPEWHIADFAIQGVGAASVPIYF